MSDQNPPSDDAPTTAELGAANPDPGIFAKPAEPAALNVFDFDELLSAGRLVERYAVICLRGDLEAAWIEKVTELASLVDDDGEVRGGEEASLGDKQRAAELNAEVEALYEERLAASRRITFRAMPEDDWDTWDAAHRNSAGNIKDLRRYYDELISRCAISPTLTVEQVQAMRKNLTRNQMLSLGNEAFWANTTGGVDVPKLPAFSHSQTPQESSLS